MICSDSLRTKPIVFGADIVATKESLARVYRDHIEVPTFTVLLRDSPYVLRDRFAKVVEEVLSSEVLLRKEPLCHSCGTVVRARCSCRITTNEQNIIASLRTLSISI